MGLTSKLFNLAIFIVLAVIVIIILPGIPPDMEFKAFHIERPKRKYLDLLQSNNILDEAELYYESSHVGIESIVELDDGSLVTSDQSGFVYKVTTKRAAVNITQLKYPCSYQPYGDTAGSNDKVDENCGWPLGMQRDIDGNILLMDYYGGMTKVFLEKGSYENLIPKNLPIQNLVGSIPEDVDVAKDGTIYWTDGCTNGDFFNEMIGQPSGRLIKYDRIKNTNEVLLNDLHFSNGVCLSENNDFVLVAEMGSASVRRYYLEGEKRGESDTFVDGLPGYPDNIRSNGRGGFFVVLFQAWNDEYSMRTHILSPYPILRKFVLRLQHILLRLITHIKPYFAGGQVYLTEIERYITELRPILRIDQRPRTAIVAELSYEGKVLNIFHGKSGKMPNLSQITAGKTYAYMACPFDNKIWRIKLDSLRINK